MSRTHEAKLAVKVECTSISYNHVLMKAFIARNQSVHKLRTNATALIIRMNEEMRVVNNKVAIGNGIAQTYKPLIVPRRDKGM